MEYVGWLRRTMAGWYSKVYKPGNFTQREKQFRKELSPPTPASMLGPPDVTKSKAETKEERKEEPKNETNGKRSTDQHALTKRTILPPQLRH